MTRTRPRHNEYADPRPLDLRIPETTIKQPKIRRLSDKAYVCQNLQTFTGTLSFYVTRQCRKKYGGVILNEGSGNFDVQIESTRGYYTLRRTLAPGQSLEFRNYPLSGVTFYGAGTYTLVAWAGQTPVDFVRTSTTQTVNAVITGQPISVGPTTGTTGIARLQPWYQPNYAAVTHGFSATGVGPHSSTIRISYTVPAGRLAIINVTGAVMRSKAPSTPGKMRASLFINPESSATVVIEEITATVGVPNYGRYASMHPVALPAGTEYLARTFDLSTGGTYDYDLQLEIAEFDA